MVTDGVNPIQGAFVTLSGVNGTYSLSSPTGTGSAGGGTIKNVPDGNYTITVTATGFKNYTDNITVTKDETFNIIMTP